jgi:hypothetical protein
MEIEFTSIIDKTHSQRRENTATRTESIGVVNIKENYDREL